MKTPVVRSMSYGALLSGALLSLCAASLTACSSDDSQNPANGGGAGNNLGGASAAGAGGEAGANVAGSGAGLGGSTASAGQSAGGEAGTNSAGNAGAGGSGPVELDPNQTSNRSGSRLKWKSFSGRDSLGGGEWFDSVLKETCTFEPAADGVLRCLPRAARFDDVYADAGCKTLAVRITERECSATFISRTTTAGCTSKREIFKLGSEIRPSKLYRGSACEEFSPSLSDHVFNVGPSVPATEFVAAAEVKPSTERRLEPRFLVADDGAVQFLGWHDTQREENCRFAPASDSTWRCLPESPLPLHNEFGEYSDGGCSKRAAILNECQKQGPIYFSELAECARGPRIFAKGEDVNVIRVRDPFNGCMSLGSGIPGVSVGDEIPPSEFVKGEIALEAGSARIRTKTLLTEDGAKQLVTFHDTELDVDCDFRIAEDGQRRCVPTEAVNRGSPGSLYSDSTCTERAYPSTCESKFATSTDATSCPVKWLYYQATEFHGPLFQKFGNDCVPAGAPAAFLFQPIPATKFEAGAP